MSRVLRCTCWGDMFGDLTIASAMIDRIVHYAHIINLTGTNYRLKNHQSDTTTTYENHTTVALFSHGESGPIFSRRQQDSLCKWHSGS
jgi:hypothetical protein